jgi:predicted RNase H-like nuclease
LSNYLRKEVNKDDILDALCGAITAMMGWKNLSSIPMHHEEDLKGLPMEMVYFLFSFYQYE